MKMSHSRTVDHSKLTYRIALEFRLQRVHTLSLLNDQQFLVTFILALAIKTQTILLVYSFSFFRCYSL